MDMVKLLNDVLRPAESKPQPLQEVASRQASMVPTPSCPEGGQRQETREGYRRSPVIDSSLSQNPEYHPAG